MLPCMSARTLDMHATPDPVALSPPHCAQLRDERES